MKNKIGIYIHIPFCIKKCDYCDFYSITKSDMQNKYIDSIINEIESYREILSKKNISTIYFGGGTPSILTIDNIIRVFEKLYQFKVDSDAEVTFEVNPETLSYDYLKNLYSTKVNRLSIGMQSMDDKILSQIGRVHTSQKFLEEYKNVKKVGFSNISVDVMFGFYEQTIDDLEKTLEKVVELEPTHISCYSLIFEAGTKMFEQLENGEIKMIDDDYQVDMYNFMKTFLNKNGYNRYEISNFSKVGYQSKHNSSYWEDVEYIGLGVSASSYIENKRFSNIRDIDKYINNKGVDCHENVEYLTFEDRVSEFFFLGLRQDKGVSIKEFEKKFKISFEEHFGEITNKLIDDKLLTREQNIIKLSEKGVQLSNYVFEKFV